MVQEAAPAHNMQDAGEAEEGMSDPELDKENQNSKPSKPTIQKQESIVSASANNKLDVVAAKAGGAMSAAAVFNLAKGKKKSKKSKAADTNSTVVSVSTCIARCSSKGAAASMDLKERCGSVKMQDTVDTDTQILSVLEDDGKMDPDSIEYATAKRKLDSELLGAKKRLKQVKEDMKRAQKNPSRRKVCASPPSLPFVVLMVMVSSPRGVVFQLPLRLFPASQAKLPASGH